LINNLDVKVPENSKLAEHLRLTLNEEPRVKNQDELITGTTVDYEDFANKYIMPFAESQLKKWNCFGIEEKDLINDDSFLKFTQQDTQNLSDSESSDSENERPCKLK
jgi:hypothetical protein